MNARRNHPLTRHSTLHAARPGTLLETDFGQFQVELHQISGAPDPVLTLACALREDPDWIPTVRVHSACLFAEGFRSQLCECRGQLDGSMAQIARHGGVIVYMFQEGRGIGLCDKLLAMELERVNGISTAEAFRALNHEPDPRSYHAAMTALRTQIRGNRIRLVTNNPAKIEAVLTAGFEIHERIEVPLTLTHRTAQIVRAKQRSLGHLPFKSITVIDHA